ncbi:MAG: hypothetical protein ACE5LU_08650 [Anaerolineae bacterium]
MPDYADLWDQYDLAVSALYQILEPGEGVSRPIVRSPDVSHRADLVITTSSRLADSAAQGLTAPSVADRERSTLRLVAGAAADLAVANDLIRAQAEAQAITVREVAATYPLLMSDLGPILRPGNDFPPTVTTRGVFFRPLAEDPAEALAQLRGTATRSFDAIAGDVIDVGQMALSGLVMLPAATVKEAAAVAAQEILNKLGDSLEMVLSLAVRLLVQAYDKILKALGEDTASEARQQAARWIEMLQSGTLFDKLLERLYQKRRILDDIEGHARQATEALMSDAFSAVLTKTGALAERFQQHRQCLEWVLRGLAFAKDWLFTIEPWGPLAVTAMYVGTLGYAVYAGGDYVDWFRTDQIQPLNRVPGLRDVVHETLKSKGN